MIMYERKKLICHFEEIVLILCKHRQAINEIWSVKLLPSGLSFLSSSIVVTRMGLISQLLNFTP